MKRRILIFASLVTMLGTAHASECIGEGCDIAPMTSYESSASDDANVFTQNINIADLYEQNLIDAAATRARVEELLAPQRPVENFWTHDNVIFIESDGCPFNTITECDIWRRKPMVSENVSPIGAKIRNDKMIDFINAVYSDVNVSANADVASPLLARYKMLMRASNSCCTAGLVHSLQNAGASDGLIYKFLVDDANFYGVGAHCLVMTDNELDTWRIRRATSKNAIAVRNECLCRNREWFTSMLAPFVDAYDAIPAFIDAPFNYTYTDGLNRDVTVSVNDDVQNVLTQLALCP